MEKRKVIKHIKGYLFGFFTFILLVPAVIIALSKFPAKILAYPIFKTEILRLVISIPLFIMGILFTVWSNIDLLRIGRGGPADIFNVEISPRTKKLVVSGPYKYTRNPMVFGLYTVYFSLAIYLNSPLSLIFVLFMLCIIITYLKKTEEKRLQRDFGNRYIEYKKHVSMFIPLPRRKSDIK